MIILLQAAIGLAMIFPVFMIIGLACLITGGNRLRKFYKHTPEGSRPLGKMLSAWGLIVAGTLTILLLVWLCLNFAPYLN